MKVSLLKLWLYTWSEPRRFLLFNVGLPGNSSLAHSFALLLELLFHTLPWDKMYLECPSYQVYTLPSCCLQLPDTFASPRWWSNCICTSSRSGYRYIHICQIYPHWVFNAMNKLNTKWWSSSISLLLFIMTVRTGYIYNIFFLRLEKQLPAP